MNRLFVPCAFVLALALPVHAQQLRLEISGGRVTLDATAVPARQILAEWARIGGTRIVGGDKVTGAPLTLKLVNVTERQALDIILRNAAGFMAAPRLAAATPGASTFDRIMILATSSVAPPPAVAGRTTPTANMGTPDRRMNGTERRVPPRPPNLPPSNALDTDDDEAEAADDEANSGASQPVFTFPAPPGSVTPGANNPVFVPMNNAGAFQPGQQGTPVITLQPGPNGPTIYNFVPNTTTTPGPTGFGVVGSPTPGMIQPAPVQPTPPTGTRPPGR